MLVSVAWSAAGGQISSASAGEVVEVAQATATAWCADGSAEPAPDAEADAVIPDHPPEPDPAGGQALSAALASSEPNTDRSVFDAATGESHPAPAEAEAPSGRKRARRKRSSAGAGEGSDAEGG